jgi:hypothetical protein
MTSKVVIGYSKMWHIPIQHNSLLRYCHGIECGTSRSGTLSQHCCRTRVRVTTRRPCDAATGRDLRSYPPTKPRMCEMMMEPFGSPWNRKAWCRRQRRRIKCSPATLVVVTFNGSSGLMYRHRPLVSWPPYPSFRFFLSFIYRYE